jgi:predicted RNA-binding Zn-ribbon protein involved in translation (DUF1610 family)
MVAKKRKKPSKRRIRLAVIPEPEQGTRSVIIYTGEGTVVMRGGGNVIMECGSCGARLVDGLKTAQLQGIVLKCPQCQAFNETLV